MKNLEVFPVQEFETLAFERQCQYTACSSVDLRLINAKFVSYNDQAPTPSVYTLYTWGHALD